jgi:hypothetical protein
MVLSPHLYLGAERSIMQYFLHLSLSSNFYMFSTLEPRASSIQPPYTVVFFSRKWINVCVTLSNLIFILPLYLSCLLGVRKSYGVPEHKSREQKHANHEERGDKESPKACPCLKNCESLYMCPHAPFYRDTKGVYILRLPSNLKNNRNVNMYMNVFPK